MKVKAHGKPTTVIDNGSYRHCPIPTEPSNQRYSINAGLVRIPYQLVNIIKENETISEGGLVQAIKRNGKCMLILGGKNPNSESGKNQLNDKTTDNII